MFNKILMKIFSIQPRTVKCWCCKKSIAYIEYPDGIHTSPLHTPFSFNGCRDCMKHRAVTTANAAWWLSKFDEEMTKGDALNQILNVIDADGTKCGTAVHVMQNGVYIPIREWVLSPERVLACRSYDHEPRMF